MKAFSLKRLIAIYALAVFAIVLAFLLPHVCILSFLIALIITLIWRKSTKIVIAFVFAFFILYECIIFKAYCDIMPIIRLDYGSEYSWWDTHHSYTLLTTKHWITICISAWEDSYFWHLNLLGIGKEEEGIFFHEVLFGVFFLLIPSTYLVLKEEKQKNQNKLLAIYIILIFVNLLAIPIIPILTVALLYYLIRKALSSNLNI